MSPQGTPLSCLIMNNFSWKYLPKWAMYCPVKFYFGGKEIKIFSLLFFLHVLGCHAKLHVMRSFLGVFLRVYSE